MFDRNAYNRQYYAELKKEPAAYEAYLELQRQKKHRRTIKRQDKLILEAAIRMRTNDVGSAHTKEWPYEKLTKEYQQIYLTMATAALYPERLKNAT